MNQPNKTIDQQPLLTPASQKQSYLWVIDHLHLLSSISQSAFPGIPGLVPKAVITCAFSSLDLMPKELYMLI